MSQVDHRSMEFAPGRSDRIAALNRVHYRRSDAFVGIPDTSGKRWFVVQTNPQCEARAEEAIRGVGYDTYCPVYRKRLYDERTKKRIHKTTPVFVGYAFVLLPEENPDVGLIRECDGVKAFLPVREDRPPISFGNQEIEVLRRIEATHWLHQDCAFRARTRRFKTGRGAIPQKHVIADGAFEGFLGIIKALGREGTVEMVTQAFGEFEQVTVPVDRVLASA